MVFFTPGCFTGHHYFYPVLAENEVNPLLPALMRALILTIIFEYPVLLLFIRREPLKLLVYTILINSFTNPLLNYLWLFHFHSLWPLEAGVIFLETLLIHLLTGVSMRYAFFCSICANGISFLAGMFVDFPVT